MPRFEVTSPDGRRFEITAPEGATMQDAIAYAQKQFGGEQTSQAHSVQEPSAVASALRPPEMAARGFTESALETIGAVPELAAAGLRAVGLPSPQAGYYPEQLKKGWATVGRAISEPINRALGFTGPGGEPTGVFGPNEPSGTLERGAYGAGRGAADVGAFLAPGAAAAKLGQAGGLVQRAGQVMTAQPIMQTAAGAIGGATEAVTDSDLAGLGAALATPFVASGAVKAFAPVGKQLSAQEQRLADAAKKYGIKLTAGQETGSRPLQAMESTFQQLPFTGRKQEAIYDAQRAAFNKAALKTAGISADDASPETISHAFKTLGSKFDELIAKTPDIPVTRQFFDDINDVASEYVRRLPTNIAPVFQSYVDDINKIGANFSPTLQTPWKITGQEYKNISSDLRRAVRKTGEPDLKEALTGLLETIDDAMVRSVPKDVAPQWREVRNHYRNLLMIDKAMQGGTAAERASGNIPFGSFTQAVRSMDKGGYARGRGQLNELARVGDFLAPRIPNSGTPERTRMMQLLTGTGLGGGVGVVAGADPVVTALGMAGGFALPPAVQAAYGTRPIQAYMRNTMKGPDISSALLGKVFAGQELSAPQDENMRRKQMITAMMGGR